MNIFFLDKDPIIAAQYHCDKHCVKMILEYAQLLSTAHRVLDEDDAHPDLYDSLLDNKLSHASPYARIIETGRAGRLVQVGIRTLNKHQREQAEKFGVEIYQMKDLTKLSSLSFSKPVYCSIDIDALDPAYAPGVSHFEPGGLSTRQLIDCLNGFKGRLIGADIVEYNPKRDFHNLTAMVAAKLLKEVIARIYHDNS